MRAELDHILVDETSPQRLVFDGYRRMMLMRIAQPAFHPDAAQRVVETGNPAVVSFVRESREPAQRIWVLANVSARPVRVDESLVEFPPVTAILGAPRDIVHAGQIELAPYQVLWLTDR